MAKRGRPPQEGDVTVSGIVVKTGQTVAWCAGAFAGDPVLVKKAKLAVMSRAEVKLHPNNASTVTAGDTTSLGAAAALMAADSRMILLEFPDEVAVELPAGDEISF